LREGGFFGRFGLVGDCETFENLAVGRKLRNAKTITTLVCRQINVVDVVGADDVSWKCVFVTLSEMYHEDLP
jgi:hypothetical protein